MALYQPGDSVSVLFTTYDNTKALVDAVTVNVYLRDPAGTWTTYTYGTDSELTKLSTGMYQLLVYVPNAAASTGRWRYEGEALDNSGNALTVAGGGFEVGVSERLG